MDLSDYLSPKERNNEAESMSENLQDNLWNLLNDPLYSFSQFQGDVVAEAEAAARRQSDSSDPNFAYQREGL